ncbi:alpha/beta hydrolase [Marivibrio halodurans]|uniref:Alpha/beta hydrolase n=1 Tax=Marivibrio halodurans TaxID=2039722 RepID=A0A8J7RWY6_9PROT|nr:alpha/beta hydrolase [Marivibrio halodurans]MBP5855925.1 alpha/beta hydrolase [Marivibrio halodurans]
MTACDSQCIKRLARTVRAADGRVLFAWDYPAAPGKDAVSRQARLTVLCLAGIARHSADFDDLARHLAGRGHRVVAPDYRGRGRSARDPNPANYRPETYLEDIRHCLIALRTGPVVVVGSSMGGLLAMGMGAAMPMMLRGAVLNDIGPDIGGGGLGRIVGYLGAGRHYADWDAAVAALQGLMPTLNPGPHGAATGTKAGPADWRRVAEATFTQGADGRLHPAWDPAIAEPLRGGASIPDLWPYFRSLRAKPVLAIRGGRSDILSADGLDRMAAAHPRLRTLTLPGKGHTPTLDEPESLEAIDGFLDDIECGDRPVDNG